MDSNIAMLNELLDGLQVIGLAVLGGAIVASNFGSLIIVRCHVRLRTPVQPPHCPDFCRACIRLACFWEQFTAFHLSV
jgi:hypothetical protein